MTNVQSERESSFFGGLVFFLHFVVLFEIINKSTVIINQQIDSRKRLELYNKYMQELKSESLKQMLQEVIFKFIGDILRVSKAIK